MKYKALILAILTFSLSSCSLFTSAVDGDNNVTEVKRVVNSFTGVELDGIGNVILTQGNQEVKIVTDSNLQDRIKTKIEDGNLVIYQEENIAPSQLDIYISNPKFEEIELDGSGSIISQTDISGDEIEIELDGSGDIKLSNLKFEELELDLDGSGDINISGEIEEANVELNGSGNIYMFNCTVKDASVKLDGSGNISVHVNESLKAEINGSGNILYKGNPRELNSQINGSGEIKKVN